MATDFLLLIVEPPGQRATRRKTEGRAAYAVIASLTALRRAAGRCWRRR